jgi:hypothetical protein
MLDQTGTTHFLFGPEDESKTSPKHSFSMNTTEDNFPTLVRQENFPGKVTLLPPSKLFLEQPTDRSMQLSASSAALDLALSQSPGPDANANGWAAFARHRPSQQSLPMNTLPGNSSGSTPALSNGPESPISVRPSYRHSLDLKYYEGQQENSSQVTSPSKNAVQSTPPKLQSSFSANDVPTMRSNTNGVTSINTTPNSHAQQHLHNHNASLGRIPPNAMNNRLSREMSPTDATTLREAQNGGYQTIQSALQASAPAFGPSITQGMSQAQNPAAMTSPSPLSPYGSPSYYNNYNMQMMAMGMQNLQMAPQVGYSPHNPYAYMYPQAGPVATNGPRDSQARVIQQRRQNDGEGNLSVLHTRLL